jgi:fatty-acyl-CoA synthase
MAAIVADERIDLAALWVQLDARLPGYAQPLFLRIATSLDLTGTFKLASGRLAKEGYAAVADPVWFNDREARRFARCDAPLLAAIGNGTKRV